MSLFAYLAGSDVAYQVRLGGMGLTSRADGSQGFGGLVFDDPDKTLDVRGFMQVKIVETACTSAPYLFSGYIAPRRVSRSNGVTTYRTGGSRFLDCDVIDENEILDHRLITNTDGNRPAETHAARIGTWLLNSAYLSGLIDDTSLVDLSNPRPFEEASYVGQYASNVFEDICSALARISFVYTLGDTGGRGLFFDFPDQAVGICTLSISNDLSDITLDSNGEVTGTVYPPFIDATETIDPSWVYSKVRYRYRNGVVIEENPTTLATFFTDNGLGDRGINVENSRIGLESTARQFANNYLLTHSVEPTTLNLAVIVPKEKAGLIRAGQFIDVKLTHIDGLETFQSRRITECQIAHADNTNEKYLIVLELANRPVGVSGPSGGAPPPDTFPHPPPAVGGIVQQVSGRGNLQLPATPTAGNTGIYIAGFRSGGGPSGWLDGGGSPAFTGWTKVRTEATFSSSYQVGMYYKTFGAELSPEYVAGVVGLNPNGGAVGTFYELAGEWTPDTSDSDNGSGTLEMASGPISAAANSIAFTVGGFGLNDGAYDSAASTFSFTPGGGWTEDLDSYAETGGPSVWTAHAAISGASSVTGEATHSGVDVVYREWAMQVASFVSSDLSATNPPSPGQLVPWSIVTVTPGSTTSTGTTLYPYADGTLEIKVDGVLISPASYTETDGATGAFALLWVIDTDEVVTVQYRGR